MPKVLVFLILALPLVGAYALYATGIVAIYQASRVLNLAHGAMATVPAFITYTLVESLGLPMAAGLPLGVASGAALGLGIERVFVRRLRSISPTAQTVGTVAAFGLLIALSAKIWGLRGLTAPSVFPEGEINVGASVLRYGHIGLFVVAVVLTALLYLLLQRTWLGLGMRGAAINRRAAALVGINPDRTTAGAWALGGALAGLSGILLAAVTTLHPETLSLSVLPAFVAALIGGLESLPGALVGSAVVGIVVGFVPVLADLPVLDVVLSQVGGPELALAVTAMIVMAARGERFLATDVRGGLLKAVAKAPKKRKPRPMLKVLAAAALIGWVWLPGIPRTLRFTLLGDANEALLLSMVAVSLVLLTGWVGQISLAQAAFLGVGAFGSILMSRRLNIDFPFNLPIAGALAGGLAALLGMVALRVRGLYLAVATLIFAWMTESYLFNSPWFVGSGGSATAVTPPIGVKGGFPFFDFSSRRTFYFLALAGCVAAIVVLSNLRRTKTGRAFLAIRGSEVAAASLGINVTRYKLLAFATAGFIAGVAGNLLTLNQPTIITTQFKLTTSIFLLSMAVVGGLQSLGGAVAAAIVFGGVRNELFFRVDALAGWLDVFSAGLLAAVLLFYPGGLAALPASLRRMPERFAAVRRRLAGVAGVGGVPASLRPAQPAAEAPARPGIVARASVSARRRARWAAAGLRGMVREIGGAWNSSLEEGERRVPRYAKVFRTLGAEVRGIGAELRGLRRAARRVPKAIGEVNSRPLGIAARFAPALGRLTGRAHTNGDSADSLEGLGTATAAAEEAAALPREQRAPVLQASGITVVFGGLTAVNDATLEVRRGEIVGLIGPNGAGKTTFFNAIAGFVVPAAGSVRVNEEDVTGLAVHERAVRGIGRTFQTIQLASEMTILENLLVATHVRNPTGFFSHVVVTRRSAEAEAAALDRVRRVVDLLDLTDVLDRPAGDLPFGTLRLVEVGRALVTGAPLIMLDEPASGLDDAETQRFARLLRSVRDRLGVSLLLIEHDVKLVMGLCDHVYVLSRGVPIADGPPSRVQQDPAVLGAYLGVEEQQDSGETETDTEETEPEHEALPAVANMRI